MKIDIEVSARHIHLSMNDFVTLFGKSSMIEKNCLSQKGQFAAEETVEIVGPKNRFIHVRVLGPFRESSQLEISRTDAFYLGIDPPLALSGEPVGATIKIIGMKGKIIKPIAKVAKRHAHLDTLTANKYNLKSGDTMRIKVEGDRAVIFDNVVVRVSDEFVNRVHLDTDEGNASGAENNSSGEIIKA